MPELILNDEQAKLVEQANGTMLVRDAKGRADGVNPVAGCLDKTARVHTAGGIHFF